MERKTAITKLLFLAMLVLGTMTVTAQVVYVDPNATGTGDGASWANAVTDLQSGIDLAATVATTSDPIQVWVKAGTYYPTTGTDRQSVFTLKNAVELYGGFDGTETLLSQRDIANNETILSADIGVSSDRTDNTYNLILIGSDVTTEVVIDGLVMEETDQSQGGSTNGNTVGVIVNAGSPGFINLTNCSFRNNNGSLGSITGFIGSGVRFHYCTFFGNGFGTSNNPSIWVNETIEVINCLFVGDYQPFYRQTGSLTVINSTIYDNSNVGIFLDFSNSGTEFLYNNIFWNNGTDIQIAGTPPSTINIANNLIEDPFTLGTNTITADPQFADVTNGDFSITHCSPAVDQGDNTRISGFSVDLNGDPRVFNTNADLGAFENQVNPIFYSAVEVGDTFCNGGSDGQISVNAGGGTGAPITYSIDGTNFSANSIFTGLSAGNYAVYATDGVCIFSETFTVNEPTPITMDVMVSSGTTANDITVSASGGAGVYQYSIDGTNFQSSGTFSVPSGPITVYSRDANNCIVSKTITISADGRLVLYVDPSATGAGDGSSWTDAYVDLQTAIDAAGVLATASAGVELWVVADTYFPDGLSAGDRTQTIALRNNVHLFGGFDGSETLRSERDFRNNLTIISGDIGVANDSTDNSYGMVTVGTDVTDEATIDGFRLQGAFSLAVEPTNGAIHLIGDVGTLNVSNCTFRFNLSNEGACIRMSGITNTTSTVNVVSSGFVNNGFYATSNYVGSAINFKNATNIYNSIFIDNKSGIGGALYSISASDVKVINNTFYKNAAGSGGDTFYDHSQGLLTINWNNNISWGEVGPAVPIFVNLGGSTITGNNNIGQPIGGVGMIVQDPQFLDESTYDLRIKHCSPAVDAGNDTVLPASLTLDFRGDPRLFNAVDIGAYENQTSPISISIVSQQNVSCNGLTDGQLEVAATGGTGATLEYSVDGTNFSTNTVFSGLAAGSYTITVRDSGNDCEVTESYSIIEPDIISIVASATDISCNGLTDGTISGTITGGTAPYQVFVDATLMETGVNADFLVNNLPQGTFSFSVVDDNGCNVNFSSSLTINEPLVLSATAAVTDVLCNGDATGSISVTAAGGTLPYSYSIDGTNFSSSNELADLSAGNYTVTVMDDNGCTITLNETITQPTALSNIAISTSDISCNGGSDGSFSFEGSGGTTPYEYSLDGINFQTSPLWENLAAGTYNYIIRDANGCTFTGNWTLSEPNALSGTVTATGTSTCSVSDGQLDVTVSGGTTPYSYSLDGGTTTQASATFAGLAAGSYTITVIDANNCTIEFMDSIDDPITAVVTTTTTDITCNGEATGSITVNVSGGTAPITYALNGAVPQSSNTFSNLTAGMYSIEVVESNGCTQTVSATINEPSALTLSTTLTDILCNGETTGEIVADVSGGTAPYEYSLDGGTFQTGNQFSGLTAGSYTLEIRDANGCTISQNETISEPSVLELSTDVITNATCQGQSNGTFSVVASGGVTPYQYSIDGVNFVSTSSFADLLADDYTITVQDANGCEALVSGTVANEFTVTATTSNIAPSCNGDANGEISITATGGTAPYEYLISGNSTPQASPLFSDLTAGTYILRVIDANGCQAGATVTLDEPDALTIDVAQNNRKSFTASASGGTAPYEYSIDGTNYQSSGAFSDMEPGNYTVFAQDVNGCITESGTIEVVLGLIDPDASIYPNPASEYVEITGVSFDQILIYNLEGKKVKESSSATISVKDLAHGVHLLKIVKDGKDIHQQKLIIN